MKENEGHWFKLNKEDPLQKNIGIWIRELGKKECTLKCQQRRHRNVGGDWREREIYLIKNGIREKWKGNFVRD